MDFVLKNRHDRSHNMYMKNFSPGGDLKMDRGTGL